MIAEIILQQLGGKKFIIMTGSKNFIDMETGLRMNLAKNQSPANRLLITLDKGTDTYTMHFYRQILTKTFDIKITEVALYEMVYDNMLQEIFTSVTGLLTRL